MTGAWVTGLTAAGVISALALALTPQGTSRSAVKLACAAMTVIMLLMPLKGFDITQFARYSAQQRYEGENIARRAEEDAAGVRRIIIQGQAEAYILDKAAELGITDMRVSVQLSEEGQAPYPAAAHISAAADTEEKKKLAEFMEGQLGIPKERQYWDTDDEN